MMTNKRRKKTDVEPSDKDGRTPHVLAGAALSGVRWSNATVVGVSLVLGLSFL